jgi:hypothetical protein
MIKPDGKERDVSNNNNNNNQAWKLIVSICILVFIRFPFRHDHNICTMSVFKVTHALISITFLKVRVDAYLCYLVISILAWMIFQLKNMFEVLSVLN